MSRRFDSREPTSPGEETLPSGGLFIAIGHRPNAGAFREWLPSDEKGYLTVQGETTASEIDGIFIAGDIHDHRYRQAITAAGEGARAAIDAERWLETAEAASDEPATLTEVR